ncbi:VanZ family protein [Salsuginibacillus kocurii]|uniref:VanZ family protein n=1 Tax=Salsuginibacillus kocurii TaxID=427078 RepID=UPI00037D7BF0|nr:VanZ family protein [Salsuginibacillus kocurii]
MEQLWRPFSDIIPLFIVLIPFVGIIGCCLFYYRREQGYGKGYVWFESSIDSLLILSIIGILIVTLTPTATSGRTLQLVPILTSWDLLYQASHYTTPIRQLVFNVLLFIPFGVFFFLKLRSISRVIVKTSLVAMFFSVLIETMQYILAIGRTTNIDDVILNTLGAFLGAVIGSFFNRFLNKG